MRPLVSSQVGERSVPQDNAAAVSKVASIRQARDRLRRLRAAIASLVVLSAAVVNLAGCMLEGQHDLATVQAPVFPLDLDELNTYVSEGSILTIKRGAEGYSWNSDGFRPDHRGGLPFQLFDTADRKGWLYQSKELKEGKLSYTYMHVEKSRDRLDVVWDPDKTVISASSLLKNIVVDGKLLTRSARETYSVLNQMVQLRALTGKTTFVAPAVAIVDANAEIARNRNSMSAYLKRATAYQAKGEFAAAIADLTFVIRTATDDDQRTKAYFRRGIAHRSLGAFDLAVADLGTVVTREREEARRTDRKAGPTSQLKDALYARAIAWQLKGDLDRAVVAFDETISHDAEANDAYYHRGLARQAKGDLSGAIADFGEAVRVVPRYAVAQAALQRARELAAAAPGEKRVALVIGNAGYRHAPRLTNPLNDANDVAGALQELGFETVVATDLDRSGMNDALARFSRIVSGADVALVYYSGHGMQWGNRNYLLPVEARLVDPDDVNRFRLLPLDDVLEVMAPVKRVRLVLLDACRNNPMEEALKLKMASRPGGSRAVDLTRGLVRAQASRGWIIAYSTQANAVALDGTTRNSPFTTAFLNNVKTVDLDVTSMLRRVQEEVDRLTDQKQVPELSISLIGEYKLRPKSR